MKRIYHRWKYDDLIEDDFSVQRNVFFIIYVVIIFLNTFQSGMLQHLEYTYYSCNSDSYNVVEARVVNQKIYDVGLLRFEKLIEWNSTTLAYCVEGVEYFTNISSYSGYRDQEKLYIAVKKDNPQKIIRCSPYILTIDDKLKCIFGWGSVVLYSFYLCTIKCLVDRRRKRKERNVLEEVHRESAEQQFTQSEICMQEIILKRCSYVDSERDYSIMIEEAEEVLGVKFHKDFIWCLKHLTDKNFEDVLLVGHTNEKYIFIGETLKMREYGIPLNYYIIAKSDEHFLCGRSDSSRLYLFSRNLGITNTRYENLYRYVLAKLEKNHI